jgi:hypothetical protein
MGLHPTRLFRGPAGPSRGPRPRCRRLISDDAEAVRNRHRRLAGGRDAVDVGGFEAGVGYRVECRDGMQFGSATCQG